MRSIPLRVKLLAMGVVPLALLIYLSLKIVNERRTYNNLLKDFIERIDRSSSLNELINELQEERKYSFDDAVGIESVAQMNYHRAKVDSIKGIILASDDPFFSGFSDYTSLDKIDSIRRMVDNNKIASSQVMHYYSNMIFRINSQNIIPYGSYTYLKPVYSDIVSQKLLTEISTYLGIIRSNIYNVLLTRQYMVETLIGTLGSHDVLLSYEKEFNYKASDEAKRLYDSVSHLPEYASTRDYMKKLFTTFQFDSSFSAESWWQNSSIGVDEIKSVQNKLWKNAVDGMNDIYNSRNRSMERTLVALILIILFVIALLGFAFVLISRDAAELRRKVNEKTKDLLLANRDLHRSNRELEEFAYVASHDLQEPLRKIQTFADIIQKNPHDQSTTLKFIDKLNHSARRMSELMKSLLNYSRLSKSDKDFEPVDLNIILKETLSDLDLLIEEKNAKIQSSDLPVIKGNRLQLQQLFTNLVGNSLKFSDKPPVIDINSKIVDGSSLDGSAEVGKKYVEIKFADNGIGFQAEYAEQIFTIFQRLHGAHMFSGTGIGLALCKKITENHGGQIHASSNPGEGATFTVHLPV